MMELHSVPILHIQGGKPMHRDRGTTYAIAIVVSLVLLLGSGVLPGPFFQAAAADIPLKVYGVSFAPRVIYAAIQKEVKVSLSIDTEPALISESVNLIRINPDGTRKVVTRLYDDGTHGDATLQDGTFTNNVPLNEPQPATLKFQFSVGYKGELKRRLSNVYTLEVRPNPNFEGIWKMVTEKLSNGDLEGALQHFCRDDRSYYRQTFTKLGLITMADILATARDFSITSIREAYAELNFFALISGEDQRGRLTFWEEDGAWRIHSFGFLKR
jgi:hypothetical protein